MAHGPLVYIGQLSFDIITKIAVLGEGTLFAIHYHMHILYICTHTSLHELELNFLFPNL